MDYFLLGLFDVKLETHTVTRIVIFFEAKKLIHLERRLATITGVKFKFVNPILHGLFDHLIFTRGGQNASPVNPEPIVMGKPNLAYRLVFTNFF